MKNLIRTALMVLLASGTLSMKAQVPSLSSYTSANPVIYLDFDGHYVEGTMWNVYGPFNCNSSGLDATQITEIFNRVSEDFRPFNINVTTNLTKYNQAPVSKRMRVVITTSHEWYGTGAGGVAYLNSFIWGDDTPAFVFSALFNYSIKNIAEASSHEAGHTLGLRHQSTYDVNCVKISDYNWGYGTGEIGWAPIMGAGYGQNMTLWHNGPNSTGCNNFQTELSIITNNTNGFGYRADDYTDAFPSAANASFNSSQQFNISGIVEKTDDKDLFKFTMPTYGNFELAAIPYNVGTGNSGSDLDLQVEFLDAAQNSIGVYNPGSLLNSIIDTNIASGNYYLRVEGKGNIYALEYGSLGSYSLLGSYTEGGSLPVHKLELKGQLDRSNHNLSWEIVADEKVINQVIEYSFDGRNFMSLATPNADLRNYSYQPAESRPVQYRLHVTFDNYREYYSNIITIRQGIVSKPQLIGNLITGTSISVNSPDNYDYRLIDQKGRVLSKGTITKGFSSINTGNLVSGIYVVTFANGHEQWNEKIVKQ